MRKVSGCISAVVLGVGLLVGESAFAVPMTVDFNAPAVGTDIRGANVLAPGLTIQASTAVKTNNNSPGNGFDGSQTILQDNPRSLIEALFATAVTSVSIIGGDFNGDADNLFLRAFNGATLLTSDMESIASTFTGGVTLSVAAANITRVEFGTTGTFPNSVFWDDLTYDTSTTQPPAVPEPATLLLFGSGLAGLAVWRHRKGSKV